MDELLLTDAGLSVAVHNAISNWAMSGYKEEWGDDAMAQDNYWVIRKAQLAKVLTCFKEALEQSRKGEPIDLPEEAFELFSAIQNSGIAKVNKHRLDRPDREKIKGICLPFLEGIASNLSKGEAIDFEKVAGMFADQILALLDNYYK